VGKEGETFDAVAYFYDPKTQVNYIAAGNSVSVL
jgi:hypothetical protein